MPGDGVAADEDEVGLFLGREFDGAEGEDLGGVLVHVQIREECDAQSVRIPAGQGEGLMTHAQAIDFAQLPKPDPRCRSGADGSALEELAPRNLHPVPPNADLGGIVSVPECDWGRCRG